jgi:hypothetical protein
VKAGITGIDLCIQLNHKFPKTNTSVQHNSLLTQQIAEFYSHMFWLTIKPSSGYFFLNIQSENYPKKKKKKK